jgi:hypothetical protein
VLANDLVGSVPLETLGAGVPRENHTIGVQHENRIISDAFNEEPESLLVLLQFFVAVAGFSCHGST